MPTLGTTVHLRVLFAILLIGALSSSAHTIGPDPQGYTATDEISFSWDEIAVEEGGSGTEISTLYGQDDAYAEIPVGFTFKYYGNKKTNLYVSVNGLLAFSSNELENAFSNVHIPNGAQPNDLIATFWDDLNLWPTQKVYYAVLGTEPYRRLVIEYWGAAHYDDPDARYYFETVLYETWNQIRFRYRAMNNGPSFYLGDGRSATLGIEDGTGANGLEWSYNRIRTVSNNMELLFFPIVQSDLQLTKTADPSPVFAGADLTYTLTVTNIGPDTATEVTLVDTLPPGIVLNGVTNSQGTSTIIPGSVTCHLGTIPDGTSAVVTIHITVPNGGVITNIAMVAAAQTDPHPIDNTATQETAIISDAELVVNGLPAQHGTPAPYGYGTNLVTLIHPVTNQVETPAGQAGGTRYICAGWNGTNITPNAGTSNTAVFSMNGNGELNWLWNTEHFLQIIAHAHGSIGGAVGGWKPDGYIYDLVPSADEGYYFSHWIRNSVNAGSAIPLTVVMDAGYVIEAVFTSAFKNVSSDTSTEFINWTLNRQLGTFFGTMQFCNNPGSGLSLTGPFWYEVAPTVNYRLMHPDGTNALDGLPYVDITAQVQAQLPGIGNGNGALDPGECVTVNGIEFYFRTRVPVSGFVYAMWADPPGTIHFDEPAADTDRDGIPNGWEDAHGLNKQNPFDGPSDPDGDAFSSYEEYLCGTEPMEGNSYLHITAFYVAGNKLIIEWMGNENTMPYQLKSKRFKESENWLPAPAGQINILEIDPEEEPHRFLRIQTR